MPAQGSVRVVRFGEYELDLEAGELRRHDRKLSLPDQAFRILAMLVERPGEIITREQLIARLWPNGMVVEFDHGINSSVRRLRAVLNDSAEHPRYIETLPKRGYRFIFSVEVPEKVGVDPKVEIKPLIEERHINQHRWKWRWVAVGMAGVAVLACFSLVQRRSAQMKPISSIAILPLVNTAGDPNTEYLADGISEEIINTLSATHNLKVIARTSAFRFKGKQVDPQKAGRELGVGAVLTGALLRQANTLVIQTDLIKISDGSELWGARYQRPMSALQTVQSEIALEIASKLRLKLARGENERLTKRYTENSEAYDLYLKAADAQIPAKRLAYLEQSIAKDPNFALAYVQLANQYNWMASSRELAAKEAYQRSRDAASKALALDEGLAEAHVALAHVFMNLERNWRSAERELKQAIDMNPNIGHFDYSFYLTMVGRRQEALTEALRAEENDPISEMLQLKVAFMYHMNRQYDKAIATARAPIAQVARAFAFAETGNYAESIAILKVPPLDALGAGNQGHLGYAYAKAGNRAEAERICLELQRRAKTEGVGAYEVAFINGVFGKKDEAFKWLDIAFEQLDPGLTFLKVDPCLDPLRSDPRFDELLRRVGLAL